MESSFRPSLFFGGPAADEADHDSDDDDCYLPTMERSVTSSIAVDGNVLTTVQETYQVNEWAEWLENNSCRGKIAARDGQSRFDAETTMLDELGLYESEMTIPVAAAEMASHETAGGAATGSAASTSSSTGTGTTGHPRFGRRRSTFAPRSRTKKVRVRLLSDWQKLWLYYERDTEDCMIVYVPFIKYFIDFIFHINTHRLIAALTVYDCLTMILSAVIAQIPMSTSALQFGALITNEIVQYVVYSSLRYMMIGTISLRLVQSNQPPTENNTLHDSPSRTGASSSVRTALNGECGGGICHTNSSSNNSDNSERERMHSTAATRAAFREAEAFYDAPGWCVMFIRMIKLVCRELWNLASDINDTNATPSPDFEHQPNREAAAENQQPQRQQQQQQPRNNTRRRTTSGMFYSEESKEYGQQKSSRSFVGLFNIAIKYLTQVKELTPEELNFNRRSYRYALLAIVFVFIPLWLIYSYEYPAAAIIYHCPGSYVHQDPVCRAIMWTFYFSAYYSSNMVQGALMWLAVLVALVCLAMGCELAYLMISKWSERFCSTRTLRIPTIKSRAGPSETFEQLGAKSGGIILKDHLTVDACERYLFMRSYIQFAGAVWSNGLALMVFLFLFLNASYSLPYIIANFKRLHLITFIVTGVEFVFEFYVLLVYPVASICRANSFTEDLRIQLSISCLEDYEVIGGREKWLNMLDTASPQWCVYGLAVTWEAVYAVVSTLAAAAVTVVLSLLGG